ncbi:nucleotidyltransferase family protein [Candidatus Woesearchaeota archaeon]|nr:nucleotidyltransferase family protein [Candidatus Woesearchaeota archaeon]
MKAIILAAGYATRLYPLTLDTPKPLLEVGKKRMVEHIIHKLEELDAVDEIHIVTNDKFCPHFVEWRRTFPSITNIFIHNDLTKTNEDRLGAIGDVHFVIEKAKIDDDVVIVGGDNLFDFSLLGMYSLFRSKKGPVNAARDLGDPAKLARKFGTVQIDLNNRIISFEEKPEKPKSSLASTCVYMYTKKDIEELESHIKKVGMPDNTGDFVKHLMTVRDVFAYPFEEHWYDIGSHEQLEEARQIFSRR